jgi:phenylalanyl-tRNA synthetase alpha chain
VPTTEDVTRKELSEVEDTGSLPAGEKALAELKKRKLVIQK